MSHLTYAEAIVTGLVQGVTELFPISSLGHNVLIPALIGGQWATDLNVSASGSPYLAFIVGLHVATAAAMILFFWRDWVRIVRGLFSSIKNRELATADQRLAWLIILACVPVGIVGLLAQKIFTQVFATPHITAIVLAINGVILLYSERVRRTRGAVAEAGATAAAADASAMAGGAPVPGGVPAGGVSAGGVPAGAAPGGYDAGRGYDDGRGGYGNPGYGNGGYGNGGYGNSGYGNSGYGNSPAGNPGYGNAPAGNPGYGNSGYDAGRGGSDGRGDGRGGYDDGRGGYGGNSQEPPSWQQQPGQQQWQGPDPRYDDPRYGRDEQAQGPRFSPSSPQDQTQQFGQDARGGDQRGRGQDPRYGQGGAPAGPAFTPSSAGSNDQTQQYSAQQYGRRPQFDPAQRQNAQSQNAPQYGGQPGGQALQGGQAPQGGQPGQRGPEPWQPRQTAGAPARKFYEQPADSDDVKSDGRLAGMTFKKGVGIGAFQIAALFSGISRDGIVTVGGMMCGLRRQDAVRFSFLLSAPVILAAGVLKVHDLFGPEGKGIHGPVLVGSLLAFIGAYLSVRFLTRYFSEDKSLKPFGIYCIIAGVLSFAYLLIK